MSSIREISAPIKEKEYWRSLEHLANTPEFQEYAQREFPEQASELTNPVTRRTFLSLMGASLAMAGLTGCRRPVEKIIPYVVQPEEITPGIPQYYATAMPFGTSSYSLIAESNEGRPTKIEGNPKHPASLGATNALAQATILNLYDPDRSQSIRNNKSEAKWADFVTFWQGLHSKFATSGGKGLAVLSEPFCSPTLNRLAEAFKAKFPEALWVAYDPINDSNIFDGLKLFSGQDIRPVYHLDKADVILALDADFMLAETDNVANAKGFAARRRVQSEQDSMNRFYAVEGNLSITGGMADHRLRLASSQIGAFVEALAFELQEQGVGLGSAEDKRGLFNAQQKWLQAVAKDLISAKGRCLVVAGQDQGVGVHALVAAINFALGNVGQTVTYHPLKDTYTSHVDQLAQLVGASDVNTLVVLGGNPVYNAPTDLNISALLGKVENSIRLGYYFDETSEKTKWHIHQTHFLEEWGDVRSSDGTVSLVQPLIAPLFDGRCVAEIVHLLTTGQEAKPHDIVKQTWANVDEKAWRRTLHDGLMTDSVLSVVSIAPQGAAVWQYLAANPFPTEAPSASKLELVFKPSSSVYDGRYANNAWLQETPDTITKLVWDNAALMSPRTAETLGVKSPHRKGVTVADMVQIGLAGQSLEIAAFIVPGLADNMVVLPLGYGREAAGRVGNGPGFNTYKLRMSKGLMFDGGASISKSGKDYTLTPLQDHWLMEGRPIVREATLEGYRKNEPFLPKMTQHPPLNSLWDEPDYTKGYQWGMTIDLNSCIGCNACMVACQSENNVPVVGKKECGNGREMHWIRIDRYFAGTNAADPKDLSDPEIVYQPVQCQHCENAPCEQVCPVAATTHDKEGLNMMVYNRCVGTRYCANNCPYKVRRFNFYEYSPGTSGFDPKDEAPEILKMAKNPDVSVRMRGVMEKCSYCSQRINEARVKAKLENRTVGDADLKTACQQVCPAEAITFGNIVDSNSHVVNLKKNNRNYALLEEINTKPRTTFLAKLRNPNPELA